VSRRAPVAELVGFQRFRHAGRLVAEIRFPDRHAGDDGRATLYGIRRTRAAIATVRIGDSAYVRAVVATSWPRERDADVWLAHRRAGGVAV
jgi:hypothetical protein